MMIYHRGASLHKRAEQHFTNCTKQDLSCTSIDISINLHQR